jgi:GalNAc-alpha-(1->4)-GalNAc-alpha-(1->3)-diNAcBac-PP-undecaprenol alpha-1,4-N-acetyl-D-galactosaminyltransferase
LKSYFGIVDRQLLFTIIDLIDRLYIILSRPQMRVTLLIYALSDGGAQRVMSILANYWVSQGWDVNLIMLVSSTKPPFYKLDDRIAIKSLDIAANSSSPLDAIGNTWQRVNVLKQEIIASKPDVVISFMTTVNVYNILACWGLNIPTIVCEHTYPGAVDANKIWQLLMKWSYRHADIVTVLTQNAVPFYPPESGYRTIVMPNPVMEPEPIGVTDRLLPDRSAIAVGRLDPRKGFDLLIRAFDRLRDKYPDWQLTILGEGDLRTELEDLRAQLQLTDRVHLPGAVSNVRDYLAQAELFVVSSRVEGFPMGLCEAMACGLPVIATDCLSGPRDIIQDGIDGMLIKTEDLDALTAGLDTLMSDPLKRQQLAKNAPKVLDKFGLESIMNMWKETIEEAIARPKPGNLLLLRIKIALLRPYNYLVSLLPIKLANKLLRIHQDMNWSISIYEGKDFLSLKPTSAVNNPVLTRKDITDTVTSFVADPFMIRTQDDEWLMFFEILNYKKNKGEIAFARSKDGYRWNYQQVVLTEKFHLSYPYVFKYESDWYMIPESCEANSVRLYKAKRFPDSWEFVKEILVGGRFVDSSILNFDGLWWLFVGVEPVEGQACNTLRLYYADSPLGDWVEHPMSPVVSNDMKTSRPGGRMRQIDNRPIRFTQDCLTAYGYNLKAIRIDTLTTTEYAESTILADDAYLLELGTMPCNHIGMHQLDFMMLNDDRCLACTDSR